MKKRILLVISALLIIFGLAGMHSQKIEAAYGKRCVYTTQKALRGTWYYRDRAGKNYKIYRMKITAHKIGPCHLYIRNSKPVNDFDKWNTAKQNQAMKTTKYWLSCRNVKYKGQTILNTMGWFQSAGDGTYYIPARKYIGGRYVRAIRIAGGATMTTMNWAVPSKALARKVKIKISF